MKVLLLRNYPPDDQRSMIGYGKALFDGLTSAGVKVDTIAPKQRVGAGWATGRSAKWRGYLDKFLFFQLELRRRVRGFDLVHVIDHGNSLYFGAIRKIPNIVTCHDLLAVRASRGEIPGWKVSRTGTIYQQMVLRHVARFQRIISVSETTKRDLIRLAGVAETRTEVIPTAMLDLSSVIDNSKTEQVVRALGINSPYIMHIGNNSPYKNRSGAVSIYREFAQRAGAGAPRLLMTGKPIPPELLRSLPSDAYVVEKPTDEQVTALYSHAEALVFPSLFEGFGLPILEAQMRDCPVFASDRGPMNEIGGDAALYFDPSDEALAGKFIFDNWTAREEMRTRGRRNVLRFERACVLGQLTTAYERVLS